MTKTKYQIGDTVYLPNEDPKANTIWTIERITKNQIYLYHPIKGEVAVYSDEIEQSPF